MDETPNTSDTHPAMVRFQIFLTPEQKQFLRKHAYETGISGSHAIRKGLRLYARTKGVDLSADPYKRSIVKV